jgi:hypothetical protein
MNVRALGDLAVLMGETDTETDQGAEDDCPRLGVA